MGGANGDAMCSTSLDFIMPWGAGPAARSERGGNRAQRLLRKDVIEYCNARSLSVTEGLVHKGVRGS